MSRGKRKLDGSAAFGAQRGVSRRPAAGPSPGRTARRDVFLSLGSNLGDRAGHLRAGLDGLAALGARPVACSPIYRTEPVGRRRQPEFLNLVVEVETAMAPAELLVAAQAVEASRGRRPDALRWSPRTLDVDLLLDGGVVVEGRELQLPHPRCHLRRFVLVPLADVAPDARHPVLGRTVADLLAACADRSAVAAFGPPPVGTHVRAALESPGAFG